MRVLIVDRDGDRAARIAEALSEGSTCVVARDADSAYAALINGGFSAVLAEYCLGNDASGLELLEGARDLAPRTLRILYTRHYIEGLVQDARRLARAHAVIAEEPEALPSCLCDALADLNGRLDASPAPPGLAFANAEPPPWRAVSSEARRFLADLRHAAESTSPVFVYGDPGSGKHLVVTTLQQWRREWKAYQTAHRVPAGRIPALLIRVPALSERIRDLPALAEDILASHAEATGTPVRPLTPEALADLMRRQWRGNVRELQVVLRRAAVTAARKRVPIGPECLPADVEPGRSPSQSGKAEGQLAIVLHQLRAAGSVRGAAKLEGIPRANYMRIMRRLGVMRADAQPYGEDESEGG